MSKYEKGSQDSLLTFGTLVIQPTPKLNQHKKVEEEDVSLQCSGIWTDTHTHTPLSKDAWFLQHKLSDPFTLRGAIPLTHTLSQGTVGETTPNKTESNYTSYKATKIVLKYLCI